MPYSSALEVAAFFRNNRIVSDRDREMSNQGWICKLYGPTPSRGHPDVDAVVDVAALRGLCAHFEPGLAIRITNVNLYWYATYDIHDGGQHFHEASSSDGMVWGKDDLHLFVDYLRTLSGPKTPQPQLESMERGGGW